MEVIICIYNILIILIRAVSRFVFLEYTDVIFFNSSLYFVLLKRVGLMKKWIFILGAMLLLSACANISILDTDSVDESIIVEGEIDVSDIAVDEPEKIDSDHIQDNELTKVIITYLKLSDFKDDLENEIDITIIINFLSEHTDSLNNHLIEELMELVTRFDGIFAEMYSDLMLKLFNEDGDSFVAIASGISEEKIRYIQNSIAYANSYFPESKTIETLISMKMDKTKNQNELDFIEGLLLTIEKFQ